MRSLKVANFLGSKGFTVFNLKGGIHVYSLEVDSSVPIY
jgi:predicted sulfurtransferase